MPTRSMIALPPFRPKLLALDMDGTLLDADHRLSRKTQEALLQWINRGRAYVVATGRHFVDVEPYKHELPGNFPWILDNGGTIWDPSGQQFHYHDPMERSAVLNVTNFALTKNCAVFISFTDGRVFSEDGSAPFGRNYCREHNIFQHVVPGALEKLSSEGEGDPFKMSCIGIHEDLVHVQNFVTDMALKTSTIHHHPELKGRTLKSAFGMPQLLDVQPTTLSKAAGLKKILNQFQVEAHEIVAVGDGMNDEEMIRWAGFGYAMGNANPALIAIAQGVLPSNKEDGVARLIHALIAAEESSQPFKS